MQKCNSSDDDLIDLVIMNDDSIIKETLSFERFAKRVADIVTMGGVITERDEVAPHADEMASLSSLIKKSEQAYIAILRQAIDVAVTALQAIETDGGSGFAEMTATTALQRIREILK